MNKWLRYLWLNENGFFGIGQGPTKEQEQQYGNTAALANFATGEGEKNTLTADNFWRSIMSGDPSKIAQVIGPQLSGINERGQQAKKTASEFHNRGGGTNAGNQMIDDKVRTQETDLLGSLTGQSASALGASGSSLLGQGLSGHEAAFGMASDIQKLKAAKMNDLFKTIVSTAGAIFAPGGTMGALFKGASADAPGAHEIAGAFAAQPTLDTSYQNDVLS